MKKIYYDKELRPVVIDNNAFKIDDKTTILNIECLAPTELAKICGLYTYQAPKAQQKNGKPARPGKLVIDKNTGTCTHELVELTTQEIAQQEEDALRAEYEAEQQAAKDEAFEAWKKSRNLDHKKT